jgi:hypothetical protein
LIDPLLRLLIEKHGAPSRFAAVHEKARKNPARFPGRAQFVSFNFTNNLIWAMASSVLLRRRSVVRHHGRVIYSRLSGATGFDQNRPLTNSGSDSTAYLPALDFSEFLRLFSSWI